MKIRVESIESNFDVFTTTDIVYKKPSTNYTIKVNVDGFDPYFSDKVRKAIEDLDRPIYFCSSRCNGKSTYAQYIDEINNTFGIKSSWRVAYEKERDKFEIKDVIFNDPATIVLWADGTKTVVKAENEPFDPEKGLAMAISKRALGDKYDYYDTFKKYVGRYEKKQRKG